jgi:hypothetical protein
MSLNRIQRSHWAAQNRLRNCGRASDVARAKEIRL